MDRTGMVAIILGALVTVWTVGKTWGGKKNK
jgi:hypothetical protein